MIDFYKFCKILDEASRWKSRNWKRPTTDTLLRLKKYNRIGYYCHFTDVPKIGINPSSEWMDHTPPGIYSYTVKYALEKQIVQLPFANEKKFIWVFRAKNPKKIKKINSSTDEIALIWKELQIINKQRTSKQNIIKMSNYFLRQGIEGIVDNGTSTIHSMEPYQAVFFGSQTIIEVDFFENKLIKDVLVYHDKIYGGEEEKEITVEPEEEKEEVEDFDSYYNNNSDENDAELDYNDDEEQTAYGKSPW